MKISAFQLGKKKVKVYTFSLLKLNGDGSKVENVLKHMFYSYKFDLHGLAFQMHENYNKCITANYNSDDREIDWFESLVG